MKHKLHDINLERMEREGKMGQTCRSKDQDKEKRKRQEIDVLRKSRD